MKKFRYILSGVFIFLCLSFSCSGGTDPGGSALLEEEKIEEKEKDPNNKGNKDEIKEDDTGDIEDPSEETPPSVKFLYCRTLQENEIVFEFSGSVSFVSLSFDSDSDLGYKVIEEKGSEIIIKLTGNSDPGLSVKADLQVIDEYENPISKKVTFRTRNDRIPLLQINELRTENDNLKAEFIEFKMISSGNLGALRVFAAWNNEVPLIYEFEPVEVKENEYVVLHLRKLEGTCKDEYGENLGESGGTDSCPTARDFWIQSSADLLRKTDAVYVMNQDGEVLDAVMFAENSNAWLSKSHFAEIAAFLFKKGAWKSLTGNVCSIADAVDSSKTTPTRTICRDETVVNTHTAANWYVTITSGATPGRENNTKRYTL